MTEQDDQVGASESDWTQIIEMPEVAVGQASKLAPSPSQPLKEAGRAVQEACRAVLAIPRLGTWVGLACMTAGFVLLIVAWSRTAALLNIGLQVPYLVSAGLGGLALICVGILFVALDAKATDARLRSVQMAELRDLVAQLNKQIGSVL